MKEKLENTFPGTLSSYFFARDCYEAAPCTVPQYPFIECHPLSIFLSNSLKAVINWDCLIYMFETGLCLFCLYMFAESSPSVSTSIARFLRRSGAAEQDNM